jgi:hypothetical protein
MSKKNSNVKSLSGKEPEAMKQITWKLNAGTPDFSSDCGRFVALYERTHRSGFASYRVFRADAPKRDQKLKNALCVGGLPEFCYWERKR